MVFEKFYLLNFEVNLKMVWEKAATDSFLCCYMVEVLNNETNSRILSGALFFIFFHFEAKL